MVTDPAERGTERVPWRAWLGRAGLLLLGCLAGLALLELGSRLWVDPVDFLYPIVVRDEVLRWRVEPGSGGHDAWGFRNPEVPARAEIVAVGDSQTYGFGVPAARSWPRWLARLAGRPVYNLALGGYGPLDYEALIADRALALEPRTIVVGLYLGNDLLDAHRLAHARERYAPLRRLEAPKPLGTAPGEDPTETRRRPASVRARRWLAERSVAYRLAGTALGGAIRWLGLRLGLISTTAVSVIHGPGGEVLASVDPISRYRGLNGRDPRVMEGLEITLAALDRMAATCRQAGVRLAVLGIPTKVRVLEPRIRDDPTVRHRAVIDELLRFESDFAARLAEHVRGLGLIWIDGLAALQGAEKPVYPASTSGHPNGRGHRRLARAVADALAGSGAPPR